MKERTEIYQIPQKVDQEITIAGWVDNRRDHGKLIFLDIRDHTGIVQVVVNPQVSEKVHQVGNELRSEYVVVIKGGVNKRPEKLVNPDLPTGTVEVEATEINVLDKSETPPFNLSGNGYDIREEKRLEYRYLDLRRPRLQNNLKLRHKVNLFFRNYLSERGFVEIETPYISKSTPEGARDYVIPSRLQPGKFYALPQSPQQYKQLLMVSGIDKYFQLARNFRDEDTRGDRQPEFTQLDIEKSFTSKEEILEIVENIITALVKEILPNKKMTEVPFPRIEHKQAMEEFGSDRPDLRKDKNNPNELAFAFIVNFPMFEEKEDGSLGAVHHPFTLPTYDTSIDPSTLRENTEEGKKLMELLSSRKEALKLFAFQYDLVCNGLEVGGGSIRIFDKNILKKVFETLEHSEEEFQEKFGHIYNAFQYGVPPHGGIALGLDRLISIFANEPNIREVIAFPKTGDARDLTMDSPSPVSEKQLKELHIKTEVPKEKK